LKRQVGYGNILLKKNINGEEIVSSEQHLVFFERCIVLDDSQLPNIKLDMEPLLHKENQCLIHISIDLCKKNKMKAIDAAKYLIELYKNAKVEYNRTPVKIGKLLTLASLLYANNPKKRSRKLLDGDIISLGCGSTISNMDLIDFDEYTNGEDASVVIDDNLIPSCIIEEGLEYDVLFYIFRNFGAYSQYLLGRYIEAMKPEGVSEFSKIRVDEFVFSNGTEWPNDMRPFSELINEYWGNESGTN